MIILASQSPRRREILKNIGIEFQVVNPMVDESVEGLVTPSEYVSIISKRKAVSAVNDCMQNGLKQATIIAADTIVSIEGEILGKPQDRENALIMLRQLENKWHKVYTGLSVAFMNNGDTEYVQDCCVTNVKFKHLTETQIEEYINTGEPFDKAGAYAIQGKGGQLIEKIEGDYYNVVGLPVDNLISILNIKHSLKWGVTKMSPKEILLQWVEAFNNADVEALANLYDDNATNHQVANMPVYGKQAIRKMFLDEFNAAEMTCIVENIFEDGDWAILEWRDPLGLRGCGFFQVVNDKIVFQRGYWDKLSFLKQHNLPIE